MERGDLVVLSHLVCTVLPPILRRGLAEGTHRLKGGEWSECRNSQVVDAAGLLLEDVY